MKIIDLINLINEIGYEKFMENNYCYIPKNINLTQIDKYVLETINWLRFVTDPLNKERQQIKSRITLIDLYFVSSTPFERFAERNLLSYYDDQDLYGNFGRIGNYLFPEEYKSKCEQLDAFVAFSKFRFGYFNLLHGEYIEYIKFKYPIPTEDMMEKTIMKISDIHFNKIITWPSKTIYTIPILQLYWLLKASWPYFTLEQQTIFIPFISNCEHNGVLKNLISEYSFFTIGPFKLENYQNLNEKKVLEIPANFKSIEQKWPLCLICNKQRNENEFKTCGHGICNSCLKLGIEDECCPFCNDSPIKLKSDTNFPKLLEKLREMKNKRNIKFDFIGNDWIFPKP